MCFILCDKDSYRKKTQQSHYEKALGNNGKEKLRAAVFFFFGGGGLTHKNNSYVFMAAVLCDCVLT